MTVVGWTTAYLSNYPMAPFSDAHKKALVERIRKRRYNFNYSDHQTLSYCAPFYDDNTYCILSKAQWDSVMSEAYKDIHLGARVIPMDVIDRAEINSVLYEKEKFEPKDGENNG